MQALHGPGQTFSDGRSHKPPRLLNHRPFHNGAGRLKPKSSRRECGYARCCGGLGSAILAQTGDHRFWSTRGNRGEPSPSLCPGCSGEANRSASVRPLTFTLSWARPSAAFCGITGNSATSTW